MNTIMSVIGYICSGAVLLILIFEGIERLIKFNKKISYYRAAKDLEILLDTRERRIKELEAELALMKDLDQALKERNTPYRGSVNKDCCS